MLKTFIAKRIIVLRKIKKSDLQKIKIENIGINLYGKVEKVDPNYFNKITLPISFITQRNYEKMLTQLIAENERILMEKERVRKFGYFIICSFVFLFLCLFLCLLVLIYKSKKN